MSETPKISTENQKPVINSQEEAKELLKKVKDSGNNELRYRMIQEYKKLNYDKVKDIFLQTTKKCIKKLSSEKNISYKKYLEIKNAKQSLEETNKIYSKSKESSVKSIFEIGKVKYEQAMGYIATFGEVEVSEKDVLTSFHDSSELNKTQLNEKQRILIERILGTNEGFNDEYLQGFNKEKGNYLIKISDFEEKYNNTKDIQTLNSLELGNYIKYLSKKNDNKSIKIINDIRIKLGPDTKFFKKENDNIKKFILDKFNEIENKFNKFMNILFNFNNINNFIEEFKGNSKTEQEEIINHLKNGLEKYKQDFINSIISSLPDKYGKEEKEEIANTFVEDIINTTKTDDIILKIGNFNKYYNSNVNIKKSTEDTLKIKVMTQEIKTSELIYEGKYEEAKISDEKMKQVGKDLDIMFLLDEKQSNYLYEQLQNGESFDNVIQDISQENKELKKLLEKNEHEEREDNHENEEDEENKKNNQYYIDDDEFRAGEKTGTYDLAFYDIKLGYVNIKGLTKKEKLNTIRNPEGLKNMINFYKFLKDLNLEGVWKYRKELALSMGDVNININDNNSVSEAELLKFGKKLIQVINSLNEENPQVPYKAGYKLTENTGNLSAMKAEIRNYSGANSDLSNDQTYNIKGEDKFTASLRNHGIIGGAYFHTMQLRKLMK